MPGAAVGTTITLIPTPELPKSATIVPGLPTLADWWPSRTHSRSHRSASGGRFRTDPAEAAAKNR
jgi:hypothetical protein